MSIAFAQRVASGDTSREVFEWMAGGFAAYLAGKPLDAALGLDRASLLRERNRAIIEAAALLDTGSLWKTAGLLEEAIRRFETITQPMLRAGTTRTLGPLDAALAAAFATGQRITRTQAKLYEFLVLNTYQTPARGK